jgi:hypothetical protein
MQNFAKAKALHLFKASRTSIVPDYQTGLATIDPYKDFGGWTFFLLFTGLLNSAVSESAQTLISIATTFKLHEKIPLPDEESLITTEPAWDRMSKHFAVEEKKTSKVSKILILTFSS